MTTDQELRDHYKRLLEAASAEVPPVEEENDSALPEATAPVEEQGGAAVVSQPVQAPRFPPNPHRFAYRQGETVQYFDEAGILKTGVISGPPVGDRYDVVTSDGSQEEVIKSELFYPAGAEMADAQPVAEDQNTA
jgi:hypothetical protein